MEGLKASVSASAHLLHQIALVIQDASGFRVNPCIIAPETANPAPTKIAELHVVNVFLE